VLQRRHLSKLKAATMSLAATPSAELMVPMGHDRLRSPFLYDYLDSFMREKSDGVCDL